jgi:hypothetical protein
MPEIESRLVEYATLVKRELHIWCHQRECLYLSGKAERLREDRTYNSLAREDGSFVLFGERDITRVVSGYDTLNVRAVFPVRLTWNGKVAIQTPRMPSSFPLPPGCFKGTAVSDCFFDGPPPQLSRSTGLPVLHPAWQMGPFLKQGDADWFGIATRNTDRRSIDWSMSTHTPSLGLVVHLCFDGEKTQVAATTCCQSGTDVYTPKVYPCDASSIDKTVTDDVKGLSLVNPVLSLSRDRFFPDVLLSVKDVTETILDYIYSYRFDTKRVLYSIKVL